MHTIETLAKRIAALETLTHKLASATLKCAEGINDVELRNLFVMSKIAVPVKRTSVIYDGQPKVTQMSLLELFDIEKDAFVDHVMSTKEREREQVTRTIEDASERIASASASAPAIVGGNAAGATPGAFIPPDSLDDALAAGERALASGEQVP